MTEKSNFYTLPFYKKVLNKVINKFKNFKINYFKMTILLIVIAAIAILWALTTKGGVNLKVREPYNKSGFIEKEDFKKESIVLNNSRFTFEMDASTTHFSVVDHTTGKTWTSKPSGNPTDLPVDVLELFVLYYERKLESAKSMSINDESIKYEKYAFREYADGLEVLYTVGGKHEISKTDLPQKIPVEKFQDFIIPNLKALGEEDAAIRRNLKLFEAQYLLYEGDGEGYYYLRNIDSTDGIQVLYDLLFVHSGYTLEDLAEDNARFGLDAVPAIPTFEFSVKYTLTDDGLDFKLINASIVESKEFPVAYIDVLPYFGSGKILDTGYIMIPDGSGVVIDYNNGKYNSLPYNRRIYGQDNAITSTNIKQPEDRNNITLPMYGMNNNDNSFIHSIEEGAAMTNLLSGFKTEYSGGQLKHKFAYSHYRYFIRERDAYVFTGIGSDQKINVWTNKYNTEDFSTKLMFVEGENQTYVGMAKLYQQHLLEKEILKQGNDLTNKGTFNLTLLGGFKTTDYFLGLPYEKVESLTNTKQAKKIVDELIEANIENINLSYQGWANDGIKPTYMNDIDFNKVVGKEKDFIALAKYLNKNKVNFIPEVYVNTAFTKKGIKVKNDVIYDMFWNNAVRYAYDLATMVPNPTKMAIYSILPSKAVGFMKSIEKQFSKLGFKSIGLIDHGSELNSSFHKENTILKNDSINYFIESLDQTSGSFEQLMIRNPHQYALSYTSYALDVATSGTNYQITDYSVPFVQLVLNGYLDYSGNALNVDDRHSLEWHKLKAIETGSNLNFTWSYEDTIQLTQTEYSQYYSTHYKNWIDKAVNAYHELNDLDIYGSQIEDHKVLNKDGSLVEVSYKNGLVIRINYNNTTYEVLSEVAK
jgi:hypothetical protein